MTKKRLAANRKNALKSTGPRTPEGKRRASMNALKHGLRSVSLAVPILENPKDWEAHHDLVVRDLSPVGYLETVLSERMAALLWRLGRAVRYETEVISQSILEPEKSGDKSLVELRKELPIQEKALQTLRKVWGLKASAKVSAKDVALVLDEACTAFDVDPYPEDKPSPVEGQFPEDDKWTRDAVDKVLHSIQAAADESLRDVEPWEWVEVKVLKRLTETKVKHDARSAVVDELYRKHLLPTAETLDKVSRYETHLERSLFRTLHELQRLQEQRLGHPVPTMALDVNVSQEAS